MKTRIIIAFLFICLLPTSAQNIRGLFDEASSHKSDEATFRPEHPFWKMKHKAEMGNVEALVYVGMCYLNGYYVSKSYSTAFYYLDKVPYQGAAKNAIYNDLADYGKSLYYFMDIMNKLQERIIITQKLEDC